MYSEQDTHSRINPSSSSQSIPHLVDEDWSHIDNGFDGYSSSDASSGCLSSSTAPTSVSGGGTEQRAANEAFIDVLYSTVDLRKLIQPALNGGHIDPKRLTGKLRKVLKLLGQDLSAELQYPESTRVGGFFKKSSKLLSYEIINGLSNEERYDVSRRAATSRETDFGSEGDELDDSSSEEEPATQPDMLSIQSLIASTNSFSAFITRLVDLVNPSFESRLKRLAKSQSKEVNDSEPKRVAETVSELLYSEPVRIHLAEDERASWLDKSKSAFKAALSDEWNWWPFTEPQLQPPPNFATLSWTCICGDIRREVVPEAFARRVVKIRAQTMPVSSASTAASPNLFKSQNEPSPSQRAGHGIYKYQHTSIQHATPGHGSITSRALPATISMPSTNRYILFFVDSGGLKLSAIESESLCNEQLFRKMRSEFRRIKGWFKTWFGLMTFSHCDFYQFEQWHPDRYCERRSGVPPIFDKDYFYQPRPLDEPPLSKHEFYDRFYERVRSESCLNSAEERAL
ncbi:phosphorylase superfamily [Fusarium pseudocircinatum]|uniref:Phosphorylase superfamily n=1 Tax=Fusarium pseudocircinatum TaxID=56676 RepID=A0A8H5KSA6_9HYPO|nr:phosphorylase superfamily [Fusarium pseudocircinatum]